MNLDYVKIPFTNNPSMTRYDGPIYNKTPNKNYLSEKVKQMEYFGNSIYGETDISKTNNLLNKLIDYFDFDQSLIDSLFI